MWWTFASKTCQNYRIVLKSFIRENCFYNVAPSLSHRTFICRLAKQNRKMLFVNSKNQSLYYNYLFCTIEYVYNTSRARKFLSLSFKNNCNKDQKTARGGGKEKKMFYYMTYFYMFFNAAGQKLPGRCSTIHRLMFSFCGIFADRRVYLV